jgi:ATP/maltotriose-dependent transcriptional regulator MalT
VLIASGLSNREIGERAFISENTVKTHSSRLFDKLGVQRRVQAVQRGRELGLIP